MSDLSLQRAIMHALSQNPYVHADEISLDVKDGYVILRGTVGSPIQHAEAARTTRRIEGVVQVDDQLRVRPMGIDGRADADTEAAVLDALIADDELHASDVAVDVDDGTVTLRGIVELSAQRERAQRIAMAVPGVSHVRNRLKVWLPDPAEHRS
jgi:osmotically-inducible protein OsmY